MSNQIEKTVPTSYKRRETANSPDIDHSPDHSNEILVCKSNEDLRTEYHVYYNPQTKIARFIEQGLAIQVLRDTVSGVESVLIFSAPYSVNIGEELPEVDRLLIQFTLERLSKSVDLPKDKKMLIQLALSLANTKAPVTEESKKTILSAMNLADSKGTFYDEQLITAIHPKQAYEKLRQAGYLAGSKGHEYTIRAVIEKLSSHGMVQHVHRKIGLLQVNGRELLVGQKLYGAKGLSCEGSIYFDGSKYMDNTKKKVCDVEIKVAGTIESLREGLLENVIGHTALELSFIVAASGLVNLILKKRKIQDIILVYVGEPETGKDTANSIAGAVWTEDWRLTMAPESTDAAIEHRIYTDAFTPVLINYNGKASNKMTRIISVFADKHGRDTTKRNIGTHYMPLQLTSNGSIRNTFNDDGDYGWLKSRIFELAFNYGEITRNKEHANRIEQFVADNYGIAGDVFIQHLASLGNFSNVIDDLYQKTENALFLKHPELYKKDREGKKVALLLTTALLLEGALDVKFNKELTMFIQSCFSTACGSRAAAKVKS